MVAVAVTFDGTRVDPLDTNDDTGHWEGSGGAPAAEAPLAYHNGLAVNKKTQASTLAGIDFDPAAGALDMTAAANKLWFVKVYVSDAFDLDATFGVSAGVGSANTAYYKYNLAGTGAKLSKYDKYPSQGGYLLTAIDPNIAAWRDASGVGSPSLTAVDWFGVQCAMINGTAKSENLAFDAIDVGTGLTLVSGDGADDPGVFPDFVAADQDNATTGRWGCCSGSGDKVTAWCLLVIGSATATEFTDTASIVTFSDGYHSAGLVGVKVDLSSASSIIVIDSLLIGEGTVQVALADDTRPDLVVTGTSGSFDSAATLRNFRNVTFTSACTIDGAILQAQLLTQASSSINNTTLQTNSLVSVAFLQDPTFGTSSGLRGSSFVQTGAGHALEIDTVGSYTFTNLKFSGYGADTNNDAAIYVSAGTGTVDISIVGGDLPTYKTAGATVNITQSKQVKVIVKNQASVALQGISVRVEETDGTLILNGSTDALGEFTGTDTGADRSVVVVVRKIGYKSQQNTVSLSGDTNIPVTLIRNTSVNRV